MKVRFSKLLIATFLLTTVYSCQEQEVCTEDYDIFIPIQLTDEAGNKAVSDGYFSNVTARWPEKEDFGQLDELPILTYADTAIYILTKDSVEYKCIILVDKELYYHSKSCGFLMHINDVTLIESEYPGVSILEPSDYEERPFWVFNVTVDSL